MVKLPLALGAAALFAGSCGQALPAPPASVEVTLTGSVGEVIDTALTFHLEVRGCDHLSQATVRDREVVLAYQEDQPSSATLTAPMSRVSFSTRGMAADLLLTADVTCDDGRRASSEPVAATVLPVDQALDGPWPFAHNFWVEPTGASVLSCQGRQAFRLGLDKVAQGTATLPFDCGAAVQALFGAGGARYLFSPGLGLAGMSSEQALTSRFSVSDTNLKEVAVGEDPFPSVQDGPELAFTLSNDGFQYQVLAYRGDNGTPYWPLAQSVTGTPAGPLAANATQGLVMVPTYMHLTTPSTEITVGIDYFSSANGSPAGPVPLFTLSDATGPATIPPVTMDRAGENAYFVSPGDGRVFACEVATRPTPKPCNMGEGQRWVSEPLSGVVSATPTANAVVVWGPYAAYFLDPATGARLGDPVTTAGPTQISGVLEGGGAVLLYAQSAGVAGVTELFLFAEPGKRAVDFRTTGGFIVDLDQTGRAWLWKDRLYRLLPAATYAQLAGVGASP